MTTLAKAAPARPQPADIVAGYGRLVSSICWRFTRDEDVAREAAQEVWLAVLEGLPAFRGDSSLSTWIYGVAWRVVGRYARARQTYSVRFLSSYFETGEQLKPPDAADLDHDLCVRSRR